MSAHENNEDAGKWDYNAYHTVNQPFGYDTGKVHAGTDTEPFFQMGQRGDTTHSHRQIEIYFTLIIKTVKVSRCYSLVRRPWCEDSTIICEAFSMGTNTRTCIMDGMVCLSIETICVYATMKACSGCLFRHRMSVSQSMEGAIMLLFCNVSLGLNLRAVSEATRARLCPRKKRSLIVKVSL